MKISNHNDFIKVVKSFGINTEYIIVKPNWVSNKFGEYTEPEILDWLLTAFPKQKKVVVESYTPWRGLKFTEEDTHKGQGVTLEGGKKHWDFYKKQDTHFLKTTGIGEVLNKYRAEYINITNEFWSNRCVEPKIIKELVESKGKKINYQEFYSYIPNKLYNLRDSAALISLSKIKVEENIPQILISMSVKNLFGLVPHPSRYIPYHEDEHKFIPEVIKDIFTVYTSIFDKTLWITEGIKTLVRNYCEPNQRVIENQNVVFIGKDAVEVDSEACKAVGVDPMKVQHLQIK